MVYHFSLTQLHPTLCVLTLSLTQASPIPSIEEAKEATITARQLRTLVEDRNGIVLNTSAPATSPKTPQCLSIIPVRSS
jgi:hypothetical protein